MPFDLTADLSLSRERTMINHLAWEVALDRLELDLVMVERQLALMDPPPLDLWDVPEVSGPIPADLLPRALDIQVRQAAVLRRVGESLSTTRQQRAVTDRLSQASVSSLISSAYVDLTA